MDAFYRYEAGRNFMKQQNFKDAVAELEASAAISPHFKTLELLGECFMRLGQHKKGIIPLAAATALNKGVRAPSLLAEVFLHLGEHKNAHDIAELALERDPHNRSAKSVLLDAEQALKTDQRTVSLDV